MRILEQPQYDIFKHTLYEEAIHKYVIANFSEDGLHPDPLLNISGVYSCPIKREIILGPVGISNYSPVLKAYSLEALEYYFRSNDRLDPDRNCPQAIGQQPWKRDTWLEITIAKRIQFLLQQQRKGLGNDPNPGDSQPLEMMIAYFGDKAKKAWELEDAELTRKYQQREFVPGGKKRANLDQLNIQVAILTTRGGDEADTQPDWNNPILQTNQAHLYTETN